MFLPKSRSAFSAAAVLVLVQTSAIHADTYRDGLRHFALEIPPGWREMPAAEVESFNRCAGPSPWTPRLTITAGFRQADMAPGTGPITLISAYDPGVRGHSNDHMIQTFTRAADGSFSEKDGTLEELVQRIPLRDLLRQGPLGGGVVDRGHKWIINRYHVQAGRNLMQQLQVVHLGDGGFVTLTSHFLSDEAEIFLPLFVKLSDSFRFDQGHAATKKTNEAAAATSPPPQSSSTAGIWLAVAGAALALLCTSLIIVWVARREKPKQRKKKKRAEIFSDERDLLAEDEDSKSPRESRRTRRFT